MKTINFFAITILLTTIATFSSCKSDDDSCSEITWYQDNDYDGYGNPDVSQLSCDKPDNFVSNSNDIDDTDPNLNPNTVWQGNTMTFSKANNADWLLSENQDLITSDVILTRANNRGIFNIAEETTFDDNQYTSPSNTEWALGTITDGVGNLSFDTWNNTHGGNPQSLLDNDVVLHLIHDNIYIDIKFTSWTSGGNGGGFTYERSTMN